MLTPSKGLKALTPGASPGPKELTPGGSPGLPYIPPRLDGGTIPLIRR